MSQENKTPDIKFLLQEADNHYKSDSIEQAIKIYKYVLAQDPNQPHANGMMAQITYRMKIYDLAEQFIRRALESHDGRTAIHYKTSGDILRDKQNIDGAITNYKKAVELDNKYTEALNNLGTALMLSGKSEEAKTYYERSLQINPNNAILMYNLASILENENKTEEAIKSYTDALNIHPALPEAHNNLGNIFRKSGDLGKAQEHYLSAIKYRENYLEAYSNLAGTLSEQRKFSEALPVYQKFAHLMPSADTYSNMGLAQYHVGMYDDAVSSYLKALELNPAHINSIISLGSAYLSLRMVEKAEVQFKRALSINPDSVQALNNLANVYKSFGDLDQSIHYYKRASELAPENARIYTNVILAMVYSPSATPQDIYETAKKFNDQIAGRFLRTRILQIDKNPDRKLRIGYVSADFYNHSVNYFFESLLDHHDRNQFKIFAYSNVTVEDDVTDRLKTKFDHWRNITHQSDDAVADLIESDKIDILIDISGHTADNRLLVFARKPAPVQVSWLGYPATTGMNAIDYRITDRYCEPEGMTEHLNSEKLWRLPGLFCCYGGHKSNPAVIDHPPFEDNGYTTFGCFNNFSKVSDEVLRVWSDIMMQVSDSRLLLEIAGLEWDQRRQELMDRLTRLNMPLERIILEPRKGANQFVLYNKIDIALDPFPCVGGTTSMDTVWMGVPFITLAGKHFASRMGVSILTNIGLPELIAGNIPEYISKAVSLAGDRDRLREIRKNLRQRVEASPAMDQKAFAKNMEDAYHGMWREFCAKSQ